MELVKKKKKKLIFIKRYGNIEVMKLNDSLSEKGSSTEDSFLMPPFINTAIDYLFNKLNSNEREAFELELKNDPYHLITFNSLKKQIDNNKFENPQDLINHIIENRRKLRLIYQDIKDNH